MIERWESLKSGLFFEVKESKEERIRKRNEFMDRTGMICIIDRMILMAEVEHAVEQNLNNPKPDFTTVRTFQEKNYNIYVTELKGSEKTLLIAIPQE